MPRLEFPAVDYERFANPPLRAMLGQVQFPPILRLQKGLEAVADFQDAIRKTFPSFAVEHQIQLNIVASGAEAEAVPETASAYRFIHETERWSALLAPGALTLEAVAGGRYSSYDEFADLFTQLWEAAVEHLDPGKVARQGLRYIDHLEGDWPANEWSEWINPDLLGGVAGEVLGLGLERAVSELLYQLDDGQIIFRHGITTAGPENVKGYLLDFDSIHHDPVAADDLEELKRRFDESHDTLYRFFRWCVTDRALEEFRRVDD